MKIIFFGTSDLAVTALEELLLSKHKILAVVTAPDKRKGRGQRMGVSLVKVFAQKKSLPIFQPRNLQDTKFIQALKSKSVDLFVVCAYGKILTKDILQIPKDFAINLHTSLLPKYRGAAPINWAIIKGERETGVTVFKMNEYMDRGDIILQQKTDISSFDTAIGLTEKLARLGAQVLLKAIDLIEQKAATFRPQDENQVSFAPKLKKEDGLIDWQATAFEIHNRIRGLQPWPSAFTYFENRLLKIWRSLVIESTKDAKAGEVVDVDIKKGILVQTGRDMLLITSLQLEGKRKMSAKEFILGHKIKAGEKLGK